MAKKKILIIDDEVKLLKLVSVLLSKLDLEVDTASDGQEGLEKVLKGQYDLIICDINMPKMDGIEVIKEAREKGSRDDFVFFTGHGNEELMMSRLKYGARGFIDKPHFSNLKDTVIEVLGLS